MQEFVQQDKATVLRRNGRFDIIKGVMLIILCIGHIGGYFPAAANIVKCAWAPFGFFSMAEGFVLLSAIITGAILARYPTATEMYRKLKPRIIKIGIFHVLLSVFAVIALNFYKGSFAPGDIFYPVREEPFLYLFLIIFFIYSLPLLEILPLYVIFLLGVPLLAVRRSGAPRNTILLISVLLWLSSQFYQIKFEHYFPVFRSFNPLSWQLLFVFGTYFGLQSAGVAQQPSERARLWQRNFDIVAVIITICLFCMRHQLLPTPLPGWLADKFLNHRELLPLGVVINMLVFCRFLKVLSVLEYETWPELQWIGKWFGRESLIVFSWGVFLYYLFALISFDSRSYPNAVQYLIFIIAILSAVLPVYIKQSTTKNS